MAKQAKTKVKQKEQNFVPITTDVGLLSYPYLHTPDVGRAESSNKYSAEVYVPKATFAASMKGTLAEMLKLARKMFEDDDLKHGDFKTPFTDMDTVRDAPEYAKGMIRIRAKASQDKKPVVIGPRKDENGKFPIWNDEQIKAIKGGDYVRLIGTLYYYTQQGGGIAFGLNFVQFSHEGKALGQGRMKQIENLEDIEVPVDSPDDVDSEEESEDEDLKFA